MTSRKVSEIVVRDRVRQDNGNIAALVASIKNNGLIQPIAIDTDNNLVAGGRRLEAVKKIGWTHIDVQIVETADDMVKALDAEVAENVCRKDFTPIEAAKARQLRSDLVRSLAKKNQAIAGPTSGRGAKPTGSSNLEKAVEPINVREVASKGLGYGATTLDKVDEVVAAAADETLPEPVREVAKAAVAEIDRTGKVDGAHKKLERAKFDASPLGKTMTAMNEEPEMKRLELQGKIADGILASHRALISWDADDVGAALDDEGIEQLADHVMALQQWHKRVLAARPRSLQLVKEK